MTKTTILALAGAISGLLMAAPAVSAADAMPKVKPHHEKVLTDCGTCHTKENAIGGNAFVVPKDETCIACHGDYKALAEKTKDLRFNPHASHLGDINCTVCHAAHEKPKLACNDCHTFDMKLPFADAAAKENWDKGVDEAAVAKALAEAPRETVDVLVIGAGSTGYNAAISAKRAGASVLLLEKHAFSGGNSMLAAGGYNAVGTPQQAKKGVKEIGRASCRERV